MNIELYIANKLCDLNKSDLSIRLKRQFINPTQLNSKDSQKSYTISLPSTPNNDAIFRYKNVEETDGKFSLYPDSRLYVNGLLIMEGKFRLTEINRDSYKGNLGVPYIQSVKDIFGNMRMNETNDWFLENWEGIETINQINKQDGIGDYFFPLTLYGLLTKESDANEGYTPKDVLDEQTKIRLEDMPPSFNCLRLMKRFFDNQSCTLTGTAFDDERLKNLHVSYRNDKEAQMDWSTGTIRYKLDDWQMYKESNIKIDKPSGRPIDFREKNMYPMPEQERKIVYTNLFHLDNPNHGIGEVTKTDPYHHIKNTGSGDKIIIPHSGLYKIEFEAKVKLIQEKIQGVWSGNDGGYTIKGDDRIVHNQTFSRVPIEILLIKNRDDDHGKYQFLNRYYADNTPYHPVYKKGNNNDEMILSIESDHSFPKEDYLRDKSRYKGHPNFIDPLVSKNLVSGFAFGRKSQIYGGNDAPPTVRANSIIPSDSPTIVPNPTNLSGSNDKYYLNPYSRGFCCPMLPSGGYSWSAGLKSGTQDRSYSVVNSQGYINRDGEKIKKFKVEMSKSSTNSFTEAYTLVNIINGYGGREANGKIEQVVWLEKGDILEVIELMLTEWWNRGRCGDEGGGCNKISFFNHSVSFDLKLTPFKKDKSWIRMNDAGASTKAMYWDDIPDFYGDRVNLTRFLPSNIKINDWVDNFCKAFNLQLTQVGDKKYSLDLKENSLNRSSSILLDLDKKASIEQRANEPLNLPKTYEIGFTVDKNEEGYISSGKRDESSGEMIYDDGGGIFETGSLNSNVTNQKSTFSYNWLKRLKTEQGEDLEVPVISDKEAWERSFDYREMMKKKYYDKAQRFWYKKSTRRLKSDYKIKNTVGNKVVEKPVYVDTALVTDNIEGNKPLYLNYEDKPGSIMREYFMLLNNNKNYTVVECYLTPEEYNNLDKCYVLFNGDLYLVAEADGFDPMGRKKTKLKLLRKN